MFYTTGDQKDKYAEEAIKTICSKLFMCFQNSNSYKYIDVLQYVVDSYNNTTHSAISLATLKVNVSNAQDICDKMYLKQDNHISSFKETKLQKSKTDI